MVNLSQEVIEAAQSSQRRWKIFSSLSLAQYGLESAWGQKMSGKNNPFGEKATADQPGTEVVTHEVNTKGERYEITAKFRDFDSIEEAFNAHGQLLATDPRYHACLEANTPEAAARALTGVYATDPNYGNILVRIIDGSGLKKYDIS